MPIRHSVCVCPRACLCVCVCVWLPGVPASHYVMRQPTHSFTRCCLQCPPALVVPTVWCAPLARFCPLFLQCRYGKGQPKSAFMRQAHPVTPVCLCVCYMLPPMRIPQLYLMHCDAALRADASVRCHTLSFFCALHWKLGACAHMGHWYPFTTHVPANTHRVPPVLATYSQGAGAMHRVL
jgi:hypothetical protein